MTDKIIVFYDNDCLMCSSFVRFILTHESGDIFRFCPLSRLSEFETITVDNSTIVVKSGNTFRFESNAIFFILSKLSFPAKLLCIGWIVPRFITDFVYRLISKNRAKIITKTSCQIWSENEKRKFL